MSITGVARERGPTESARARRREGRGILMALAASAMLFLAVPLRCLLSGLWANHEFWQAGGHGWHLGHPWHVMPWTPVVYFATLLLFYLFLRVWAAIHHGWRG